MKTIFKIDQFLACGQCTPLALYCGNLEALNAWNQKVVTAYSEMTDVFRSTKDYSVYFIEVYHALVALSAPLNILLGQTKNAWSLINSCGIAWDEDGFECIEKLMLALRMLWAKAAPAAIENIPPSLLIYMILSAPDGTIDAADALARLPSPTEIARQELLDPLARLYGLGAMTSYGARAFLKLGRDDDAFELARIAVSPEQKTVKRTTLVSCFSTLGEISAKRGKLDEASGYFSQALEEAKVSRLPMLEVLAARDWKRHLLEPNGRDCSAAETVIDEACAKMGKTPAKILPALLRTSFEA